MRYNFRTYLCSTVAAFTISFLADGNAYAQGVISLSDDIQEENTLLDNSSADFALFDDPSLEIEINPENVFADEAIEFSDLMLEENVVPLDQNVNVDMSVDANAEAETDLLVPINDNSDVIPLSGQNNQVKSLTPSGNDSLFGGNVQAATPQPQAAPKPNMEDLADKLIAKTNDTLFSQMSDLERQTTLLTLELRREKIKSEIEAIKAQRRRAEEEEKAYLEEKERKKKEWENEQARLLLIEEQKIIELEIAMEKERQERLVKAYKEYMLEENQNWIKNNEEIYKVMAEVERERDEAFDSLKTKINSLFQAAAAQVNAAKDAKVRHDKKVEEMQLQIAILKARLEAAEAEKRALRTNPFAEDGDNFMEHPDKNKIRLSNEYAILDVRGQGDDLVAKLMNADKKTFNVKVGTILHTGHRIDEITRNYVRGDLDGFKDFIYLSIGNAIEKEPTTTVEDKIRSGSLSRSLAGAADAQAATGRTARRGRTINTNRGIPSVSSGLMVK